MANRSQKTATVFALPYRSGRVSIKLIGIHFDFQKYFTAGEEGKSEEYAHVYFFNRLAPVAGY